MNVCRAFPLVLLALGFGLAGAGAAWADVGLLCARPEVLQEVGRTVKQWNIYNEIVESSVQEQPTTRANAVVCHVTLRSLGYVPSPSGPRPVPVDQLQRFDLQVIGNRFFVQVPR